MKQLLVAIVCTIFLGTTSYAFMPGPDIIRSCPDCKQEIIEETTLSGNTSGRTCWTDGKCQFPYLPDRPWLVKCPKCGLLFWIDQAEKLGERMWREKGKWPNAITPNLPTELDYYQFLKKRPIDRKKENYVRRRAWWAMNDQRRTGNQGKPFSISEEATTNLKALSALLDESKQNERIMKAEIARQLGEFDICLGLLKFDFKPNYSKAVGTIRTLAEMENRVVAEIPSKQR